MRQLSSATIEDLREAHSTRALSRRGTGSLDAGARLSLRSPPSDRLGVLGIVAGGIEAQAATIAGFASQLRVRGSHDCIYELSMDLLALTVDIGAGYSRLLCRHQYIASMNAALRARVAWRTSSLENGRQMI